MCKQQRLSLTNKTIHQQENVIIFDDNRLTIHGREYLANGPCILYIFKNYMHVIQNYFVNILISNLHILRNCKYELYL